MWVSKEALNGSPPRYSKPSECGGRASGATTIQSRRAGVRSATRSMMFVFKRRGREEVRREERNEGKKLGAKKEMKNEFEFEFI